MQRGEAKIQVLWSVLFQSNCPKDPEDEAQKSPDFLPRTDSTRDSLDLSWVCPTNVDKCASSGVPKLSVSVELYSVRLALYPASQVKHRPPHRKYIYIYIRINIYVYCCRHVAAALCTYILTQHVSPHSSLMESIFCGNRNGIKEPFNSRKRFWVLYNQIRGRNAEQWLSIE